MSPEPLKRRWGDKMNGDQKQEVTRAACSLWSVSKYLLADVDFGRQRKACERKMPLPVEHGSSDLPTKNSGT